MNMFWRELRAHRRSLIVWCVCMVLGVLSGMAKYPAYSAGTASSRLFAQLPHSLRALLGMADGDVTTLPGFYAFLFRYVQLTFAFHAALLGGGILAKEETDKTAEFLLAKPVSRAQVLTAKLMAAVVNVIVLNLVTFAVTVPAAAAYGKGHSIAGEVAAFHLSLLLLQLIFLAVGALCAAVRRNPAGAGAAASGVVLAAWAVEEITTLSSRVSFLNILSPFQYVDVGRVLGGRGLGPLAVLGSLLLAGALTAGAYAGYRRRDPRL